MFSPPLWPQPWPQGSEQEACPSAAALQAGAISGASATLLMARGAARSHAQEASPCHGPSGLEMETERAAGMVGRHRSQRAHRHPERRRLHLGFTEGRTVQGRKEAPRPAGRLWGSQGDFRFLFAGLVCPRPPPPPVGVRAGPLVAPFDPVSWQFRGVASLFRTLSSLHTRVSLVVMDTGRLRGCMDAQRPSLGGGVGVGGSEGPHSRGP